MHWHIKGYAEQQVIDRLRYHDYQVRVMQTALALGESRGLAGQILDEATLRPLYQEVVTIRYVEGDYLEEPA